jgi:hypothetical protein
MPKRTLILIVALLIVTVGIFAVLFLNKSAYPISNPFSSTTSSSALKIINKGKRWTGAKPPSNGIIGPTAMVCTIPGNSASDCKGWGFPTLVPVKLALTSDQARTFVSEFSPITISSLSITKGIVTVSGSIGMSRFEGKIELPKTQKYGNDWFVITSGTLSGQNLSQVTLAEYSSKLNIQLGDFASKYGMQVESVSIGAETLDISLQAPEGMFTTNKEGVTTIDLGVVRPAF